MLDHILSVLIFFPALAAVFGFMIQKESMRTYGVAVALVEFVLSLVLWYGFDNGVSGMQFVENIPLIPTFGINYTLGVDGISLFIIVLSAFFTFLGIASLTDTPNVKYMIVTLLFLQMTMAGVFAALDAIVFYTFWELSLVPMLYIIGAWGGPLRVYASIKFFLYTFAGSLVMLVGMLFMAYLYYQAAGVWSFSLLDWYRLVLPENFQLWLFVAFFIGFAIKVPMFPFHTWLPYAHGQAPTIGSIILAAILLKMGTYAFVRFSLPLFPDASAFFMIPIAILAVIMVIYTSMVAYAQKDIKQVVAYSSIAHMGIIILGTFALNVEGIAGSVFLMLGHGVVAGGLFMLVGVIYDRRHTKLMSEFGGLAHVMPRYATIFGIMMMASVGLPLTINFIGEFLSLLGFYQQSHILTLLAGTGIIVGAIYMLAAYKKAFFGEVTNDANKNLPDVNKKELFGLIPLVIVAIWLGVYPKPVLEPINNSVTAIVKLMHSKATTKLAKERIPDLNKPKVSLMKKTIIEEVN
ncbi:NADH-ubiquinone oxidoreductase chain M [hydrothermal vent metagenome]|uniref:NADH-ubiquinone oxidoreductase chain M n=1 Tax=hydrothermal vent metagenome TaxID=652676 RepID=A0A1W1BM73_9ZZZZ